MRLVLTFIFTSLFLIPLSFSQGWHAEPPVTNNITCGETVTSPIWIKENSYSGEDYNDCLPDGSDSFDGVDIAYQFTIDEESDIRFTIESQCYRGLFLMMQKEDGSTCIAFDEFDPSLYGQTRGFFGGMRVYPGNYFIIVDKRATDACDRFSLTLECLPYKPYTVCELGGAFTSCGKTISAELPVLETPKQPLGIAPAAIGEEPCTPVESFRIYEGYFENPVNISATLLNASPGVSVSILTEDCACLASVTCMEGLACATSGEEGEGEGGEDEGFEIAQAANAKPGFYYFVVTGPAEGTFDLEVVTNDCMCEYTAEPIECGQTIIADAANQSNKFDNVPAQGLDAYVNCYGRDRPYTGGDVVYEFEVSEQSTINIELTSLFNAGLFLFDANCASDCIASDETFGLNGTAFISNFKINCGVYQIMVDLEKPHAASCPFTLTLTSCEPVEEKDIQVNPLAIVTSLVHEIDILANLPFNDEDLDGDDGNVVTFYATDFECGLNTNNGGIQIETTDIDHRVYGNIASPPIKEGYNFEEDFQLKLSEDSYEPGLMRDIGFVDPSFGGPIEFIPDESVLIDISSVDTRGGVINYFNINPLDRTLNAKGSTARFIIQSRESLNNEELNIDWCVKTNAEDVFVDLMPPPSGRGNGIISMEYGPNTAQTPRIILLTVTGYNIGENIEFELTQPGLKDCDIDDEPPTLIEDCGERVFTFGPMEGYRDALSVVKEAIKAEDACSTEELDYSIQPNPFPLPTTGTVESARVVITDAEGNSAVCPIQLKLRDRSNTVGRIINTGNPNTLYKEEKEITIFNSFGQIVKKQIVASNESSKNISMDMQNFQPGIYLIRLQSGKEVISKKMILSGI